MHLIQPNRWSCLATSFAMSCGRSTATMVKRVGHDGSTILWPTLAEPKRRRGFAVNELLKVALDMGAAFTPIIPIWPQQPCPTVGAHSVQLPEEWMDTVFDNHDGVVILKDHAVAWSKDLHKILDPNGEAYFRPPNFYMTMEVFWARVV